MTCGAQNTLGLVDFDDALLQDGYALFYPEDQGTVFLVNACGQLVHEWPDPLFHPAHGVRFLDDGSIMRTAIDPSLINETFATGILGQMVQLKNWENDVLWQYEYSSSTVCMHHDIEVLPNGNVLIIAWELKTIGEARAAGRDTTGFGYSVVWPDKIIEVRPSGLTSGIIEWQWHAWDHMVQEFDPDAANYGVVADHPELIDINYPSSPLPDMHHINSVRYNPELDQILLSVPFFDEIWIIDHSTTTAQAAQHTGGNSGHGGDLLYRWGNPATYGHGGPGTRQLIFNHAAHWLGPGLPADDPDRGKIMVFNNRVDPNYSSVDILVPPVDETGHYAYVPGTSYGPLSVEKRLTTSNPADMHSTIMGSAQKLPNGNTFICASRQGWLFQLTPDSSLAWSFYDPIINGGVPGGQGSPHEAAGLLFQGFWLTPDHPGLQGRVLDPIGYIEIDPNTGFCNLATAAIEHPEVRDVSLVGDPVTDALIIDSPAADGYIITDVLGHTVLAGRLVPGRNRIGLAGIARGTYVFRCQDLRSTGLRFQVMSP